MIAKSSAELAGRLKRLLQAKGFVAQFDHEIVTAQFARQPRRFVIHAAPIGAM